MKEKSKDSHKILRAAKCILLLVQFILNLVYFFFEHPRREDQVEYYEALMYSFTPRAMTSVDFFLICRVSHNNDQD